MKSVACVLAALIVCPAMADVRPKSEPPPAQRFEHDMMVRFHMHESFGLLRAIELVLVRGKLDEGKALARSIAEAPEEPGMQAFAQQTTEVRLRAAAIGRAATLEDALRGEALLAQACATCHAQAGVVPEFSQPPRIPADAGTISTRMARHRWATERLWEGIVGDSDESWRAGLDVLSAAPPPAADLGPERLAIARQLQRMADQARHSDDHARAYGEILVTCAACHTTR